ncbi:hypothetical protein ACOMHN_047836 [Nucella lapillus]
MDVCPGLDEEDSGHREMGDIEEGVLEERVPVSEPQKGNIFREGIVLGNSLQDLDLGIAGKAFVTSFVLPFPPSGVLFSGSNLTQQNVTTPTKDSTWFSPLARATVFPVAMAGMLGIVGPMTSKVI